MGELVVDPLEPRSSCFLFQAEDGIRDLTVTGVQTCALPISARRRAALFDGRPQEALNDLLCLAEPGHEAAHPVFALVGAVDTVEAAVQVGNTDVVEDRKSVV